MKKTLTLILSVFLLSCSENEDLVQSSNKRQGIEASFETEIKDFFIVLKRTCKVYKDNYLVRTFINLDTLPSLGKAIEEIEDENTGDVKKISIPKDYEIFITIK